MKNRIIKDIPALVAELRAQSARCKDFVVPQGKMSFGVDYNGTGAATDLILKIEGKGAFRIEEQVHGQLCQKLEINSMPYYSKCLSEAPELLATNLNHWRAKSAATKRLVRLIDDKARGFVSDRYRPLSHLDLMTTAIQTITGRDAEQGGYAKGAVCFGWNLDPKRMDVCLMNPTMVIDLKAIEKGVQKNESAGYDPDGPNHGWVRGGDKGSHFVFPAAFLGNSETGFGGLSVRVGLYEAVCDNTARLGHDLAIRHLGKTLDEGEVIFSATTQEKENAATFAKVADIVRQAFDPASLLSNAKKMAGLADETIDDVREVVSEIAKLPGMTEGVRDDILAAYQPIDQRKDTLLDVQRAVTAAAHASRENRPDLAEALESLGGDLIEKRGLALVVKK